MSCEFHKENIFGILEFMNGISFIEFKFVNGNITIQIYVQLSFYADSLENVGAIMFFIYSGVNVLIKW